MAVAGRIERNAHHANNYEQHRNVSVTPIEDAIREEHPLMKLIFVRHGQPQWDIDGLGVDDPVLTEIGHQQARHTANALASTHIDFVAVSPLIRAQQTAEPILDALGKEPEVHDWLAEIAAPKWEGTPQEVIERTFAEARDRDVEQQWDGIPGGETFRDFHSRVTNGLDEFLASHGCERSHQSPTLWRIPEPQPTILFVAHSGTNAVALGHLLGIPPVPWEWERFVSFHSSISILQPVPIATAHSFSLYRFSDLSHLPENLHTR